jgi:hypothetical protein
MDVCVVCCKRISDMRMEDVMVHNGRKEERMKEKKTRTKKKESR